MSQLNPDLPQLKPNLSQLKPNQVYAGEPAPHPSGEVGSREDGLPSLCGSIGGHEEPACGLGGSVLVKVLQYFY